MAFFTGIANQIKKVEEDIKAVEENTKALEANKDISRWDRLDRLEQEKKRLLEEKERLHQQLDRKVYAEVKPSISCRAELYILNVYSTGGHFKAHVDTPRSKEMFGSLVVCLPSQFTGGELVTRHQGRQVSHVRNSSIIIIQPRSSPSPSPIA